jgi:hypothetical protein
MREHGPDHPPSPGQDESSPGLADRPAATSTLRIARDTIAPAPDIVALVEVFREPARAAAPAATAAPTARVTPALREAHLDVADSVPPAAVLGSPAGLAFVLPVAFLGANSRVGLHVAGQFTPSDVVPAAGPLATPPAGGILAPAPDGGAVATAGPAAAARVSVGSPADPAPDFLTPFGVEPPAVAPVAGLLGIDPAAVEAETRQFLDRLAGLAAELPDGSDGGNWAAWVGAAVVLAGGAGFAAWANRTRPRPVLAAPDSVLARWGEANDGRSH